MSLRLPIALPLALALVLAPAWAQEEAPAPQEGQDTPAEAQEPAETADGAADAEEEPEEEEEPPVAVQVPKAEEVAALPAEERCKAASAIKTALLLQYIRMLEEDRRVTRANFAESAEVGRKLSAPAPMVEAWGYLADGDLYPQERRGLNEALVEMYVLYGVDELAVRLFVETSGAEPSLLRDVVPWLPMEHVFNLPPEGGATDASLQAQAAALREMYTALKEQLATVHDTESADAAAEALLPMLEKINTTHPLRLSAPQVQGRYFEPHKDYLIPTHKDIRALRDTLEGNDYYGSARLRAVDYLLH